MDKATIESNKAAFVAGIVARWAPATQDGGAELAAALTSLSADRLLAARDARR